MKNIKNDDVTTMKVEWRRVFRGPGVVVETGASRGDRGRLLQFSVNVTFCDVRCFVSVNVYIKCIIRITKLYQTIDIPCCC